MNILKNIDNGVKFLYSRGKRSGICYYQVVSDIEMDRLIADKARCAGYSVLEYSAEYSNGQIQIFASQESMINEVYLMIDHIEDYIPQHDDNNEEEYKKIIAKSVANLENLIKRIESGEPPSYDYLSCFEC